MLRIYYNWVVLLYLTLPAFTSAMKYIFYSVTSVEQQPRSMVAYDSIKLPSHSLRKAYCLLLKEIVVQKGFHLLRETKV